MMHSLRDHLRQSTAAAHAALESTPLVCSLAQGRQSAAEYRQYLRAQWALLAPIERALRPWAGRAGASRLTKTAWLRADLAALDIDIGIDDAAPDGDDLIGIDSPARALGVEYVVEGNMLGLQVLRRRLPAEHPAHRGAGRYFAGYGEHGGRQWKAFVAELDEVPPQHWPQALSGAQQAFTAFHRAYAEPLEAGALHEH